MTHRARQIAQYRAGQLPSADAARLTLIDACVPQTWPVEAGMPGWGMMLCGDGALRAVDHQDPQGVRPVTRPVCAVGIGVRLMDRDRLSVQAVGAGVARCCEVRSAKVIVGHLRTAGRNVRVLRGRLGDPGLHGEGAVGAVKVRRQQSVCRPACDLESRSAPIGSAPCRNRCWGYWSGPGIGFLEPVQGLPRSARAATNRTLHRNCPRPTHYSATPSWLSGKQGSPFVASRPHIDRSGEPVIMLSARVGRTPLHMWFVRSSAGRRCPQSPQRRGECSPQPPGVVRQ